MTGTLEQQARKMAEALDYETSIRPGEDYGTIRIFGINTPDGFKGFSVLDKIWSSVKKRNAEAYGVNSTAVFIPVVISKRGVQKSLIEMRLYCNFAGVEDTPEAITAYTQLFNRTFESQAGRFMNALLEFLCDEELGYVAYHEYVSKGRPTETGCDSRLDAFLRAHGLKTPEDDAEKKRRDREAKMILKRIEDHRRLSC